MSPINIGGNSKKILRIIKSRDFTYWLLPAAYSLWPYLRFASHNHCITWTEHKETSPGRQIPEEDPGRSSQHGSYQLARPTGWDHVFRMEPPRLQHQGK